LEFLFIPEVEKYCTLHPNAVAILATSFPIVPKPIIPHVLLSISLNGSDRFVNTGELAHPPFFTYSS
jgi:hypothetical protein